MSAEIFLKKVAKAHFQLAEFVSSFEGNSNCCMVVPMVLQEGKGGGQFVKRHVGETKALKLDGESSPYGGNAPSDS